MARTGYRWTYSPTVRTAVATAHAVTTLYVKDIVTHHDFHARVLDRFGREHSKLVYGRSGRELSLTDKKPAHVVRDILV